ncbi:hypothetical protein, partial [Pseudomonas sp. RL_105y_Pfl2_101]|uniref:hypothetical protein n=1 Tax=Pseudomonas sp. RL_105y_Pfl2_101 TaxID=3088708 RepID=UPI0030DC6C04
IVRRDSHHGAGHAPDRRRIDLSKPTTSPANQYCKNGGDHRFMDRTRFGDNATVVGVVAEANYTLQ